MTFIIVVVVGGGVAGGNKGFFCEGWFFCKIWKFFLVRIGVFLVRVFLGGGKIGVLIGGFLVKRGGGCR